MSQWLDSALARAEQVNDWLSPQRRESLALLRQTPWPTRKTEAWKYTPLIALERAALELTGLERTGLEGTGLEGTGLEEAKLKGTGMERVGMERAGLERAGMEGSALERAALGKAGLEMPSARTDRQRQPIEPVPVPVPEPIPGLDSINLVLVDGHFAADKSSHRWPAGLQVTPLHNAIAADQDRVRQLFGAAKPKRHLFGLVNDVLATDGLLIEVADHTRLDKPLRIVHLLSEGSDAHVRVLLHLGSGATATVMEQVIGNHTSFNTTVAEYFIEPKATLEHYRFALQTGAAMAVGGSHFQLHEHSQLNSTVVGFGSNLSRLDTDITHAGEHAFAKLNAIYLLDGSELFDLHSTVEHAVPHGSTEENVRGIVAGQARAVFNGRIHIHRYAQKTVAELTNRNLLLSDKATINTKPELEIYADDVRCAHGATVAEIDKKALYYLQTRGIPRNQAQVMLNFGFINELVDQMPNQFLAEWLRPQLRERFSRMDPEWTRGSERTKLL